MKTYIYIAAVFYLLQPWLKKNATDEYWLICGVAACLLLCVTIILDKIDEIKK